MAIIKFAVWNMEWMNDLFTDGPAFHPDEKTVRGPNPGSRDNPTVLQRRQSLAGALNELGLDVLVVVEGPNKTDELQLFFDDDVTGTWRCEVQPTKGASQIVGLAVRTDTNKFENPPFERFHVGEGQGGEAERLSNATVPFLLDTDDDEIQEQHKFERLPLYAEIRITGGKRFRVVGLHLKSKGIFDSLEWAKWWSKSDANRMKIVAQCRQLRTQFLDPYLMANSTKDIPLIVCGDINDGPGMDASERRLNTSGIERLMGTVWNPEVSLGNALFDTLDDEDRAVLDFESLYTTSFRDPIFANYRKVWIDHILYSRNKTAGWISSAEAKREFAGASPGETEKIWSKYPHASDHQPVVAEINSDLL
jgi:endonuclease/exonuclease/phosphatase family metal-dependent hydrolase